jgi:tetratricopeptide (TPR) repeat protein
MIEQHYTDEALLTLLDARGADSVLGDPHLASCEMCSDALDSYRDIAGLLCDKDVWDEDESYEMAPAPDSLRRIRAFADSVAHEDAEAATLVKELLLLPTEWWGEEVRADKRYATAGVVRRLLAVAHEAVDSVPTEALELAGIALDVINLIAHAAYDSETIHLLRGQALREHAFALYYLNRNEDAVRGAERARDAFAKCAVSEVEIARTDVLFALIQTRLEEFDAAIRSARSAEEVFANFGLEDRRRGARRVETMVLQDRGDHRKALERYREMETEVGGSNPSELAGILNNIGNCHRHLGDFDRAISKYTFALSIFDDLGNLAEGSRTRWNVAQTLAAAGNLREAEKRYRSVRGEFHNLGLRGEAAVVSLNMAEIAVAENRFVEAAELCQQVIAHFQDAKVAYTSNAVAALSFLREAVEQRKASAAVAEAVRRYVSRLPQQPNLLFAPPPLP